MHAHAGKLTPRLCLQSHCVAAACAVLALSASVGAESGAELIARGRAIAFDRAQGNCLTCHVIAGGELPGNAGPELVDMRTRYPDPAALRVQIWDAHVRNPESIMPPYGRNRLLSTAQIDALVAFVESL